MDTPDLMTLELAAAVAGVSLATLRRHIARGRVRAFRRAGRVLVVAEDVSQLRTPVAITPGASGRRGG
jgi:predicted site-specific integrase-resolvase